MEKRISPSPPHAPATLFIDGSRRAERGHAIVGTLDTSRVPECWGRVIQRHLHRARLSADRKGKTCWADVDARSNRGLTLVSTTDGSDFVPAPSDPHSRRLHRRDAGTGVPKDRL